MLRSLNYVSFFFFWSECSRYSQSLSKLPKKVYENFRKHQKVCGGGIEKIRILLISGVISILFITISLSTHGEMYDDEFEFLKKLRLEKKIKKQERKQK